MRQFLLIYRVNMNVNTDKVFSEYVLKAMQGIRKSKLPPDNCTVLTM